MKLMHKIVNGGVPSAVGRSEEAHNAFHTVVSTVMGYIVWKIGRLTLNTRKFSFAGLLLSA